MDPMSQYILTAMLTWVPLSSQTANGESEVDARTRYESIAQDIAANSQDATEPPIFKGATTEEAQVKTALELGSISSFEGGYQKFVDEGTCNQKGYKADGRGNCDGGGAWTIWQMHTMHGLWFKGLGLTSMDGEPNYGKQHPDETMWTGAMLVADRRTAAKMALHMIRTSYKDRGGSLCGYTGECDNVKITLTGASGSSEGTQVFTDTTQSFATSVHVGDTLVLPGGRFSITSVAGSTIAVSRALPEASGLAYTIEHPDHPKADIRHGRAVAYLRAHPYRPSDYAQLAAADTD
jgi:hypothetical protein